MKKDLTFWKALKEEEKKRMKKLDGEVRKRLVMMRMNEEEYEQLEKRWKMTTERHLSNYLRKVCLQKPVIVQYRNASADDVLSGMLQLKKELHSIGSNFHLAVQRLHLLEKIPEFRTWLILNESLQRAVAANIEEIKLHMTELYEEWLLK